MQSRSEPYNEFLPIVEYEKIIKDHKNLDFESYKPLHLEFCQFSEGNYGYDEYNVFKKIKD